LRDVLDSTLKKVSGLVSKQVI